MTTVYEVVEQICLGMPETEMTVGHGMPSFKVAGRTFATYSVNHHGDGRVALLVNMSKDMQAMLVDSAPKHFFIPPYTGHKGWVGIELNKGIRWQRVAELACDAYRRTAPAALANAVQPVKVSPPTQKMKPEDIDPYVSAANKKIITKLDAICLALPEVVRDSQFGAPCYKAGSKTFATLHQHAGHTELQVWVGADRQVSLTSLDKRYRIPAYVGGNGWISFDLSGRPGWKEVEALCVESYRHFALKRMLKAAGLDS